MSPSELNDLLNHKFKLFVYATGAGAGFQKDLWNVPGCSAFLVGSEFTYDSAETCRAIGHEPESFCSAKTAMELAMAAYRRAFNVNDSTKNFIGLGLTASVASTKEHRGEHRVFVSIVSDNGCWTHSAVLKKDVGWQARETDGVIADELAALALFKALGIGTFSSHRISSNVLKYDVVDHTNEELVSIIMELPYFRANGLRTIFEREWIQSHNSSRDLIMYPGTFNPYHLGHKGCADSAEAKHIYDRKEKPQIVYTTCINPAHKDPPTAADLLKKASQMKGNNFLLTKDDALYIEKAKKNPNSYFIIGADALLTVLDPKWTKDPALLITEFIKWGARFYVAGRVIDDKFLTGKVIGDKFVLGGAAGDKFITLEHITWLYPNLLPTTHFKHLPGRWDVSSTELRNQK